MRRAPARLHARPWLALFVVVLAVGCLPDRKPEESDAATSEPDEDVAEDAGSDAAESDAAKGADIAAVPDVPLIEGCTNDKQCADLAKNPCHDVTCNVGTGFCEVKKKADDAKCGDDEACRTNLRCLDGFCTWQQKICNDGNPCTKDQCGSNGCSYAPLEGAACNDANLCTKNDQCKEGKCTGSQIFPGTDCDDDNNPCTTNACLPEKGCHMLFAEIAAEETVTCDDEDQCTDPDHCAMGECVAGGQKKCPEADGNPCTLAGCHPKLGCGEAPAPGILCNDGNACIKGEHCVINEKGDPNDPTSLVQCKGVLDLCDDDNPCTDDVCNNSKNGACDNTPAKDGAECDDGDVCSTGGTCTAGKCGAGKKKICDDGNACTVDGCDAAKGGCHHVPDDKAPCDDGSACTTADACKVGVCKSPDDGKCGDGNACTNDTCTPTGCENGFGKVGSTCSTGKCWWGQCLATKCGNKVCEPGEDDKTCAADCPAGGGACGVADGTCIATCTGERCKDADAGCANDSPCLALQGCVDKCSDAACRAGCVAKAPVQAIGLFQIRHACRMAACVKNSWSGKPCPKGVTLGDCVAACGPAACWLQDVRCKANADCASTDSCINKCNNDVACETKCLQGVSLTGTALQTALANCRNSLCL